MNLEALVRALLVRYDWRVADQRVVNTRVWHEVGLKLGQVDIESTIKPQTRSDGAHNLCDQTVQMLVIWTRDVKVAATDIIDRLVVNQESAVRVLDSAMG